MVAGACRGGQHEREGAMAHWITRIAEVVGAKRRAARDEEAARPERTEHPERSSRWPRSASRSCCGKDAARRHSAASTAAFTVNRVPTCGGECPAASGAAAGVPGDVGIAAIQLLVPEPALLAPTVPTPSAATLAAATAAAARLFRAQAACVQRPASPSSASSSASSNRVTARTHLMSLPFVGRQRTDSATYDAVRTSQSICLA